MRCFERNEYYIFEIKSLLLHSLLDWSNAFNSFPCFNLLDMLELCNLSV